MTKILFATSLVVSAAFAGCSSSKSKQADTTPAPTETMPAQQPGTSEVGNLPSASMPAGAIASPITGDEVFFAYDSAEITAQGRASLDDVVTWVTADPQRTILVRGHASHPGEADYNMELSERRADAVGNYLKGRGVNANQIIEASAGEQLANETPGAANRRVVIYATLVKASMNTK